ncbi:MAG TPA: ATP-binding protein [Pyrinomonadaceae bacterium]|nr:ATP-binding protein [Pyrinomonadaceae bacterium]
MAALLALVAAGISLGLSRLELIPNFSRFFSIAEPGTAAVSLDPQIIAIAVGVFCLLLGVSLNRLGGRRALPFMFSAVVFVVAFGLTLERFSSIDLQVALFLCSGGLSIALIQLKRLWEMDRRFTQRVISRLTADHVDSEHVSRRLDSGLKLLQTVLPLREAVVFHCDDSSVLRPLARLKCPGTSKQPNRNSVWRDGVGHCNRALSRQQLVVEATEDTKAAMVAVPLTHEGENVGALLLRLSTKFNDEDRPLLEAVGSQFGRNLKRERVSTQRQLGRINFFSHTGARKKLDAVDVLTASLAEQRCEANALDMIEDGVAIAHLDGTIGLTNPALRHYAGLTEDQLTRIDIFTLLDRFRSGAFDEPAIAVRRVLQSGADYNSELRFEDRSLTLGLRISILKDDPTNSQGSPVGLAVCVRDLTRSKEFEKLKSDMISLMSHELRTPLTSINGFAELLTQDNTIPDQAKEFVTIIANESQRLSRMINTFLAVTQLQRKDKQEVLKIPLRLDEVVNETLLTLQPMAKKKRIRLVQQPAQRIPPVAADKSLITQAVKNLVNNAIKYSPERTTVTVSTALEAEVVRVSVEDRGFGIPAESRDRVWEKFYRVAREGQDKDEESTGLGLSFVREVVEQHGGEVALNSEEGRGSTFSFTLPRL